MNGRRSERGYNLIEVLIAMAIFGVVIIAIGSLFIWGQRNVYSGKQMTAAVAIGTRVMEDLSPLNKRDIYSGLFAIADTDEGTASITFGTPAETYTNVAVRSTNAAAVAGYADIQEETAGGPEMIEKWSEHLTMAIGGGATAPRLSDGAVTVLLMPRLDPTNDPPQFSTATVMQIRVIVQWRERLRQRQVVLDTTKAY
jgi:prepilin-type N-terminal cleavage/methylation domain-containing protein